MTYQSPKLRRFKQAVVVVTVLILSHSASLLAVCQQDTAPAKVDGQPLAANVARVLDALDYLGHPLPAAITRDLRTAVDNRDSAALQNLLDPQTLFVISINPELRVKVARGAADPVIQQAGFTPVLVKVLNESTVTRSLHISSPQAGPIYAGSVEQILLRQAQTELKDNENTNRDYRFLDLELFDQSPMTDRLSGLSVEYLIALIYSSESGQREATIVFDIGEGTQDLGFRSEVPVLFSIRPAVPLKLQIRDSNGSDTTARLEFRDKDGRVYPPQAKRLAPDFFFQPQIYRSSGDTVLLPPGEFQLTAARGPEYTDVTQTITVKPDNNAPLELSLQRWVDPQDFGFYCGDHHIHAAGCSHYDNPTQGVTPQDMFAQVKGEGLNVGCVLTWGPCFDHQRTFFSPIADTVSEPFTLLKYDLEISGFGSAALGHVCLLRLNNQTYPGSDGTSTRGWPTWTVPVLRWTKEQGGITGYPHSAMPADAVQAAGWIVSGADRNSDGQLNNDEAKGRLLPQAFRDVDGDNNGVLTSEELVRSGNRMADTIPNLTLPSLHGGGAMEIFVSTPEGVCDFISAMDTARIPEWNTWYHLLNCGFPLKLSGETDFPCMSSRRVGQGRVYVQLGEIENVEFNDWCTGIAEGRSYVSDGYAHALRFDVTGITPGPTAVELDAAGTVEVSAEVCFAPRQPRAVAYGTLDPPQGRRMTGDTINLHAPRESGYVVGGDRTVEVIMNGQVVASTQIPADGHVHDVQFKVPVQQSSWIALRQFPQLHTNPVNIIVGQQPIRVSRASALWCAESVRLLWKNRQRFIHVSERPAARKAYKRSLATYLQIAEASNDDGLIVPDLSLP
jgi:hypothetical protein